MLFRLSQLLKISKHILIILAQLDCKLVSLFVQILKVLSLFLTLCYGCFVVCNYFIILISLNLLLDLKVVVQFVSSFSITFNQL